ncbi:MAG: EAL domain-containing protein [Deltaproteobacteria bacterium]|nr:EAL domain-containing protein [Deltaproteobacteria bacterium]
MDRTRFPLRLKALLGLLLVLLPTVGVAAYFYLASMDKLQRLALDNLTLVAESFEAQIYQFLRDTEDHTRSFAADRVIRGELARMKTIGLPSSPSFDAYLRTQKVPIVPEFVDVTLVAPDGTVLASAGAWTPGRSIAASPCFAAAVSGDVLAQTAAPGAAGTRPLCAGVPVTAQATSELLGYLVATVRLSSLSDVLSGRAALQDGAPTIVAHRRGFLRAFLVDDQRQIIADAGENGAVGTRSDTAPVAACRDSGREVAGFFAGHSGAEAAVATMCFRHLGWTLVVEQDKNVALAPLAAVSHGALVVAVVVGLALAGLFLLLVLQIVRPVRRLAAAAAAVGRGQLDVALPEHNQDEIGTLGRAFADMLRRLRERTTERDRAEDELRWLSATIDQTAACVLITDRDGVVRYANPSCERLTGYSRDELLGHSPSLLASGETPRSVYEDLWATILAGRTWRGELQNRTKTGQVLWVRTVITPVTDDQGRPTRFLAVEEDVTELVRERERLERTATHDELTGVLNRTALLDGLGRLLAPTAGSQPSGALLILDLDDFKAINETQGHGLGDRTLRQLAALLLEATRDLAAPQNARTGPAPAPLVGRLGGDEFAAYLPGVTGEAAATACDRLRRVAETMHERDPDLPALTASAGIALAPEHGHSAPELMSKADTALFRAKESGRSRCHVYRPEDRDLERAHSRVEWRRRIRLALDEDRFFPWFQPILDLHDGSIRHYEALARMRDEKGAVLAPGAFMEVAERFGLVRDIDKAIARKTMLLQARLARQGLRLTFDMNLSGKDLGDDELLDFLRAAIAETGAEPDCLVFEITETAAVHRLDQAARFIDALKALGCRFSLDDFGVGFGSFLYLRELKVDFLKIDGAFVRKLADSSQDRLFVRAMADVARGMGIRTVAEFVETERTVEILREVGVDFAQGYHIAKPAPDVLPNAHAPARRGSARPGSPL